MAFLTKKVNIYKARNSQQRTQTASFFETRTFLEFGVKLVSCFRHLDYALGTRGRCSGGGRDGNEQ